MQGMMLELKMLTKGGTFVDDDTTHNTLLPSQERSTTERRCTYKMLLSSDLLLTVHPTVYN